MYKEISSLKEFYNSLLECGVYSETGTWRQMKSLVPKTGLFFRGQKRRYKNVTTSLSRNPNYVKNEYQMYIETIQTKKEDLSAFSDPIEMLSKMQHYGLPTRLIDFTIDPLIALFFAVQDEDPEGSGTVYLFRRTPMEYSEITPRIISLLPTIAERSVSSIIGKYYSIYEEVIDETNVLNSIGAITFIKYSSKIEASNPRLYNQKGTFAICGNAIANDGTITSDINDIDVDDADSVILIPGAYKQQILAELKLYYEIDENYIYPEFLAWTDYMKRKYGSEDYSIDTLFTITDTNDTVLPDVTLRRIKAILTKSLGTEDIKRVGRQIFADDNYKADSYEIQLYSNYDTFTMRHWTAQCRWISKKLEQKYWPFFYNNYDEDGLEWEYSIDLIARESYYHDEVFKDPKLLLLAHHKLYRILLELFYQLDTAYEFMDEYEFSVEAVKRRHTILECCKRMFNFGRVKDNNLDSYFCNYRDFASSLEIMCFLSEQHNNFDTRFFYHIDNMLSFGRNSIRGINRKKNKWFTMYDIMSEDVDSDLNEEAVYTGFKFTQTIPISPYAIDVLFSMQYRFNDSGNLIICGTTNLFNEAKLLLNVSSRLGSSGSILEQAFCIVKDNSFEAEVSQGKLNARNFEIKISMGFPRTQSGSFLEFAGQEYEFLSGKSVDHSGLDSTLVFHDYIQISGGVISKSDFTQI